MALLKAGDPDRVWVFDRAIIRGGVIDSNGKFLEVGDPLSHRPLGSGSKG
jgi:hypothetical protein